MSDVTAVSYGGGVQSTSLLVLAARGDIDFRLFLFADVGSDSEHPATLRYLDEVATPFAELHGIELVRLQRATDTRNCRRAGRDVVGTPDEARVAFAADTRANVERAPGTRSCTADFKIRVVGQELRRRGATEKDPATVALGISVDEIERARPGIDPKAPYQRRVYPLLDLGLRLSDCQRIIADAGLPVPRRSACYFCPLHSTEEWRKLKRETPELFERACWLEEHLNARRQALGRDKVWLTRHGRPLGEAVDDQGVLPGLDGFDSGWCMT